MTSEIKTPKPTITKSDFHIPLMAFPELLWQLQRVTWRMSSQQSIRSCSKFVSGNSAYGGMAALRAIPQQDGSYKLQFGGLHRCKSGQCPRCSQILAISRAKQMEQGIKYWLSSNNEKGQNRGIAFMTLTMGHNPTDSAEKLAHAISKARTALTAGGEYRDRERGDRHNFQIAGIISRIEVTWSQRHGYHFHLHMLLMIDRPLTACDLVNLQARFHHRWKKALAKEGIEADIRQSDIRPVDDFDDASQVLLSQYLNKTAPWNVAKEMTMETRKTGHTKRSWNYFELLTALCTDTSTNKQWFPLSKGENVTWDRPDHFIVSNQITGEIVTERYMHGKNQLWRIIHELEAVMKTLRPYRISNKPRTQDSQLDRAWSAFLCNSHGLESNDASTVNQRTGVGEIVGYISPSEWMSNYVNHPENIIRTVHAAARTRKDE